MPYGDSDPEDAYDATDPTPVRLDVLERVVDALRDGPDDGRFEARRVDALRVVFRFGTVAGTDRARLSTIRAALEDMG